MLNNREKLIELLNEATHIANSFCLDNECDTCEHSKNSFCLSTIEADHLIANGVTVQKCGRWEKYGYKWRCNNCLAKINIDGTPEENGLYYCPNCGADMIGEEHETD